MICNPPALPSTTDGALLLQTRPPHGPVAEQGHLRSVGRRLSLHPYLWHGICLSVVSTPHILAPPPLLSAAWIRPVRLNVGLHFHGAKGHHGIPWIQEPMRLIQVCLPWENGPLLVDWYILKVLSLCHNYILYPVECGTNLRVMSNFLPSVYTVFILFLTLTLFLKGIVDPKLKNLWSFNHSHVILHLYDILLWRKRLTFKFLFTVCLTSVVAVKSLLHMCILNTCHVKTCWKKVIQVWNDRWVDNDKMSFFYEWTIPNHERPLSLFNVFE